jgi:hypothetical protein
MATKDDYSWLGWLAAIGVGLFALSRVNQSAATQTNAAAQGDGSTFAADNYAPTFDQTIDYQTNGAINDGLWEPTKLPPVGPDGSSAPRVIKPPIREYSIGDTITLPAGEGPPPAPEGTQWWAPITGAQPIYVTWTLEAYGTYHPPVHPQDVLGTFGVGNGDLELM